MFKVLLPLIFTFAFYSYAQEETDQIATRAQTALAEALPQTVAIRIDKKNLANVDAARLHRPLLASQDPTLIEKQLNSIRFERIGLNNEIAGVPKLPLILTSQSSSASLPTQPYLFSYKPRYTDLHNANYRRLSVAQVAGFPYIRYLHYIFVYRPYWTYQDVNYFFIYYTWELQPINEI